MVDAAEKSDLVLLEAWRVTSAEFIATLLFVFLGCGSVVASGVAVGAEPTGGRLVAIALAHGLAIVLLVSAIARISGAHINPAVTFAAMITGNIGSVRGAMYVVAQLAAGVIGALLLAKALPDAMEGSRGARPRRWPAGQGVILEVVLTFVLVFVVFATAVDPKGLAGIAPAAIGLAVLVNHLVGVPLTGASTNPARSLGPAVEASEWANYWVYWVGPLAGAAAAALVYKFAFLNRPAKD